MSQSKKHSIQETLLQTAVGFVLSFALQLILCQFYDMHVSFTDNLAITLWFTVLSLVRGYVVRRWMNKLDN